MMVAVIVTHTPHTVIRISRYLYPPMPRTFLLAFLFATAAFAQKDPVSRSSNQPVEPFRIAGNLYYVGANEVTSYLITTPAGHIVIDGGFEETAPMIIANIARLGFRISDVKYLLSSHAHFDHAGGLLALKRASGATFVSSRGDAPAHARGGLDDPQFRDRFPYPPIVADRIIDDGDTLTLGGTTLVARITPGHTRGCTTWTTTVREGDKPHSVVFVCSPTAPDYNLTTNRRYPNAVDGYRRQFAILHSLHPDIFLASHGSFFHLAEKMKTHQFVDPQGYEEFVDAAERSFDKHVAAETIVIHDATVIDGTGAPPRPHTDVVLRNGRIADVANSATFTPPPGARVIDGAGKFIIPGLIDMHAHLLGLVWNEKGDLEDRWNRATTLSFMKTCLRFGVTTVRDPGAVTENAVLVRRLLRDGEIDGPQLFVAGRILNSSSFNPDPFVIVRDEASIRDEIKWQSEAGVDFIKIYSSMTPDLAAIAIREAHQRGLPVIGHLQRTTWTDAARLGIDGVEHAAPWSAEYVKEGDRAAMPNSMFGRVYWLEHLDDRAIDEMIAALVEHHVVVDPTLMATMQTKFWANDKRWLENPDLQFVPENVKKGWAAAGFKKDWTAAQFAEAQATWPVLQRLMKRMDDRGVQMVVGTDAPTPWIVPGGSVHDEMRLLVESGIPPLDVLRMATSNAARTLRQQDEIGAIRPGLRADIILLAKNPLQVIENTRSIELVVQNGTIVFEASDHTGGTAGRGKKGMALR